MAAQEPKLPVPSPDQDDYVEKLLALCRWSEVTERYEDMCEYLKLLLKAKEGDLDDEQRNLFSVGFKSVVGNLRRSWRSLDPENGADFGPYRTYIQKKIETVCGNVVELIKNPILTKEEEKRGKLEKQAEKGAKSEIKDIEEAIRKQAEAETFYHKMVGDYERYKAELKPDEVSSKAADAYKKATEIAEPLPDTDSTKLGLALNYSVCLFEISKQKEEAVKVAKAAFDNALKKLDELDDNDYKNSTLIMQLLRDNLTLWTSESDPPPQED
jgi:hypothetical protein